MNKLVLGAFAFALAAASPALAENHHGGGGNSHNGGGSHSGGGHGHMGGGNAGHSPSHGGSHHVSSHVARHEARHVARHEARHVAHHVARHEARHVAHHVARHEARHAMGHAGHHAVVAHGRFANLRRAYRAPHRFHVGVYRRPHGWYHRHWVVGAFVPRPWFVRDYWITDFGLYGLIAPTDGLVWVRVGPDALLIDPGTGEVVQVVYGIFW